MLIFFKNLNLRLVMGLIFIFFLASFFTACSSFKDQDYSLRSWFGLAAKKKDQKSPLDEPQALALEGQEKMEADDYKASAETFKRLKDQYPYSKYAVLAELRLGDALYNLGKYQEAQAAYEDFERLHPQNPAVPYALYQQGMANYQQVKGYDRDQTGTIKTIQTFARLVESYPDSSYTAMAQTRIAEAQNILAGHEFNIGEYYFKRKEYQAALNRFVGLVKYYPDSGFHQPSLDYISECQVFLADGEGNVGSKSFRGARPEDSMAPATGMF